MIAFFKKILEWFFVDCEQLIQPEEPKPKKKYYLYKYKNRIFKSDPDTIKRLNNLLANFNSEERYKRVLKSKLDDR